jgi:AcrR family transcriptional regulator
MSRTSEPSSPIKPKRGRAGSASAAAPNRAERAAERRQAIVEAALQEFVARGFTATRLDDIAKRAGVAKGTIYLHFKDKESMFEELIRTAIVPLVGRITSPPPIGASIRDTVEHVALTFIQEIVTTPRADIVRLIIAEGARFPAIADFYYREVISRGLAGMRALIELAVARGEIRQAQLARFPQIMIAPAIVAVIWKSLFERHSPLDAVEMFRVHLDLIFGERSKP